MSFKSLPGRMASYATYELAQLLVELTGKQREAIDRIVQHHYIESQPMATLFRGEDKVCTENNFYKKGRIDEETGQLKGAGWIHQKKFTDALAEAARLALQSIERENLQKLVRAKQKAVDSAENAVQAWIDIFGAEGDAKARVSAADKVVTLAFKETETKETEAPGSQAADWWAAAE